MAQLTGFACVISWLGADHTYVASDDGFAWPCWGGSSGGRAICAGPGSSAQANCLSQTDSHAGIIYGVTGVCHQTANRILWPSRTMVAAASGYWASTLLYGIYGTSGIPQLIEWEARKALCTPAVGDRKLAAPLRASIRAAARKPVPAQSPAERKFLDQLEALHSRQLQTMPTAAKLAEATTPDLLPRELDLIADYKLGSAKDPKQIAALQQLQADAVKEKTGLAQALNNRTMGGEEYANKINDLFATLLKQCAKTLDSDRYAKLLDLSPDVSFGIVDPKIMAKHHK